MSCNAAECRVRLGSLRALLSIDFLDLDQVCGSQSSTISKYASVYTAEFVIFMHFCVCAYTLWVLYYDELIELASFFVPLLGSPYPPVLETNYQSFTDDGDCLYQTSRRG